MWILGGELEWMYVGGRSERFVWGGGVGSVQVGCRYVCRIFVVLVGSAGIWCTVGHMLLRVGRVCRA